MRCKDLIVVLLLMGFGMLIWNFYVNYDRLLPCPNPIGADPITNPECFISKTLDEAQFRFVDAASKAGAEVSELRLPCGHSIHVAMLRGVNDSGLLLHVSGTHGVEGFVGSAIQTAFLRYNAHHAASLKRNIVFVHGLNAYGMANWRRVNENNVDLNRNAHFDELGWENVLNRDPNIAGYEDWNYVLNPKHRPRWLFDNINLLVSLVGKLSSTSFGLLKRAMVTGTYSRPNGIFFGGRELQPSHVVLRNYLLEKGFLAKTRDLIVIDVHSGLGPLGKDTLMMNENLELATRVFTHESNTHPIPWNPPFALELQTLPLGVSDNDASAGYDLVTGDVQANYYKLFKSLQSFVSVTQEFGTVPGAVVAFSLVKENQAFHYGDVHQRLSSASNLKDVFCPLRQSFARSIIHRGIIAIVQSAFQLL